MIVEWSFNTTWVGYVIYITTKILLTLSPLSHVPFSQHIDALLSFYSFPLHFLLSSPILSSLCHSFSCRQMSATSPPPSPLQPSHLICSSHLYCHRLHSSLLLFAYILPALSSLSLLLSLSLCQSHSCPPLFSTSCLLLFLTSFLSFAIEI